MIFLTPFLLFYILYELNPFLFKIFCTDCIFSKHTGYRQSWKTHDSARTVFRYTQQEMRWIKRGRE